MRKIFAAGLVLLIFSASESAAQDGGTRSIFSLGAGARGIALGRAMVSVSDDAEALYWNPAALRNVQRKQLVFTYMPLFGDFSDATYTYFGAVYPTLGAGSFGFAFMRVGESFEGYDAEGMPTGEGEYAESQVIFAYAFERHWRYLLGTLATGVSFKISNVKVSPYSSTAPGIDLGFRYRPDFARSISVGVNLQDISGAEHKLVRTSDKTYRTVMAGLGYTKVLSNGSALRLMLELDMPELADREFHIGAEYMFSRLAGLRVGLDDGDLTFGLGVEVGSFGLDYATFSRPDAGSSHSFSFSSRFGRSLNEQRRILAERRAREQEEAIRQAFNSRIESHRQRARESMVSGDFASALDEWKIVLEYVPADSEAAEQIKLARRRLLEEQEKTAHDLEKQAIVNEHFSLGLKYYSENDYARAREHWRKILEIAPDHAEAAEYLRKTQAKIDASIREHMVRARSYEREGRLVEAVGEWNNVSLLDPENPLPSKEISRIRKAIEIKTQDYEKATRKLKVLDLYNNALEKFNEGDYRGAMKDLETLLRLEPAHEEARNLLRMAKRKLTPLSDEEKARIRKLFLKGMEYFSKDRYREAIAEWEKILEIDPANESVKKNIEEARTRLRKLEEGE